MQCLGQGRKIKGSFSKQFFLFDVTRVVKKEQQGDVGVCACVYLDFWPCHQQCDAPRVFT